MERVGDELQGCICCVCVLCQSCCVGVFQRFFPNGLLSFPWFFPGGCGPHPPKFSLLVGPSSVCPYMCGDFGVVVSV